jgi:hypothetical protein
MEINRRKFIRNIGMAGLAATATLPSQGLSHTPATQQKPGIGPTPQQKAWMELQFGMFIHFGIQMEANLLLNCGPMASGLLRPEDESTLKSLRQ